MLLVLWKRRLLHNKVTYKLDAAQENAGNVYLYNSLGKHRHLFIAEVWYSLTLLKAGLPNRWDYSLQAALAHMHGYF